MKIKLFVLFLSLSFCFADVQEKLPMVRVQMKR